jgi:ribonuclease HI
MKIEITADGACSNNPGMMGLGIVIADGSRIVKRISESAGFGTNNRAEYLAVIRALEEAKKMRADEIKLTSDSQLVIKQITGKYKIKSQELLKLKQKVDVLLKSFKSVKFIWAGREGTSSADALAKAGSLYSK